MERLGRIDPEILAIACLTAALLILSLLCLFGRIGAKPLGRRKARADRD